ncbi:MAG: MarR family winged helix-turn-helix transcriptional regulator [Actinophytocola sp.]|uniref:MarR family winged helix-turn-helix transcriptional regulator n=1 Tax=Actinophytocola sp. TaxID=1872138 RepID=UPI003D6ABC98
MVAPEREAPAALTEREIESGHRLAGAMFTLGKQQASLAHRMSKGGGVDRSTIILLKTLVMHGPSRSSELATAVYSDPSTVSRQVAALVRDGLVERRADPEDGRASVLAPTDSGLAMLAEQRKRMGLALAQVVKQWDPDDVARFLELFERFVADHERALPMLMNECVKARSEGEN